jgi:hypothetical protein
LGPSPSSHEVISRPLEKALRKEAGKTDSEKEVDKRCRQRAKKMLADLTATNPKAAAMVLDPSPHVAAICPRRAGKTYAGVLAALITGEAKPGSISLIISLNLKQLRRLYWAGGPSGLFTIARKYGLNLEFNNTSLRWEHENGSIGYLLGADDDEQLEVIRGLEADLYLIDECKSFNPVVLDKLIEDIIDPQRATRKGRVIMIGTPGFIMAGPFYQATCPAATFELKTDAGAVKARYSVDFGTSDPHGRDGIEVWSRHHWTLQDNTAMPHQWVEALKKKKAKGWDDADATWQREYLGMWTATSEGLVFRYFAERANGRCIWQPDPTPENPTGLPEDGAPWRLVAGLDIGYEAPTAFVVAAYSSRLRQLRVIADYSHSHMLVPDIADMIMRAQAKYGPIERIYADVGNLGKMVVETLIREYGFPLERADKREKYDHIELLNAAFAKGEVLIVPNTQLEVQLLTNCWDLRDEAKGTRDSLARRGKLREDDSIPNDSTDALLYLFRGSLHHFGWTQAPATPEPGSPEWRHAWEKAQLAAARREFVQTDARVTNALPKPPTFLRRALTRNPWSPPKISTRT